MSSASGYRFRMAAPLALVLEDEALVAMDLESALLEDGFSVVLARSCSDAFSFLEGSRPDVAILDVRLPDGDCKIVARTLAQLGVPFIVYTGALLEKQRGSVFAMEETALRHCDEG